jgi:hypothetical protein
MQRDATLKENTLTEQSGIWSRFKTAVMQPSSLSTQSILKSL